MNEELLALYKADKYEHANQAKFNTLKYKAMRARDLERRQRVMGMAAMHELQSAEDYFHAAHIMNHGATSVDAEHAYQFALRSSEMGHRPARWLAAASYDRWQMYQGKPQKYGTNYVFDGQGDRLWDVDPATTDAERAEWDVPPLAEQIRKAEEANSHRTPMSEREWQQYRENAPDWLKEALRRWNKE
jgi:hypothetical protein